MNKSKLLSKVFRAVLPALLDPLSDFVTEPVRNPLLRVALQIEESGTGFPARRVNVLEILQTFCAEIFWN